MRIIVAHGYSASPRDHWFPWLRERYGDGVLVPALPDSTSPRPDAWVDALGDAIGTPDDDTILVGHSLGCITTLRVLERLDVPWSLGGVVLVSGFVDPVPGLPELDPFTTPPLDVEGIARRIRLRHVIGSDDDAIVPPGLTARLARRLDAPLTIVPSAGHFLAQDGHLELPRILPVLEGMGA